MTEKILPYIRILKLKMVGMLAVMVFIGFYWGNDFSLNPLPQFLIVLFGASIAAAGSLVLNQYLEYIPDGKMDRTKNRPIPLGHITPFVALLYGTALTLGGVFLVSAANLFAAFLTLLIAFLYVLVYTPLKQITWLNTTVGAIPGAIPPLVGWAGAQGQLSIEAWILFLILFIWQHPHFFAIAWLYKEDYAKGGYKHLPNVDKKGTHTMAQVVIFSLMLIPAAILPFYYGFTGKTYLLGSLILSLSFLFFGIKLAQLRNSQSARRLLYASLAYLPLLVSLILFDAQ